MDLKERETPLVFISYSHQDAKILKRLRVQLKPLEQLGLIEAWDDTRIKAGDDWKAEVDTALVSAKAAILLISADFLASDFIVRNELPPLLEAAKNRGTLILPLILNHCSFLQNESLSRFQAFNPPSKPLAEMNVAKREKVFHQVYERIRQQFPTLSPSAAKAVPVTLAREIPAQDPPLEILSTAQVVLPPSPLLEEPLEPASRELLPSPPRMESPPQPASMQSPSLALLPESSHPLGPLLALSALKKSPLASGQTPPPARKPGWAFYLAILLLGTISVGIIWTLGARGAASLSTADPGATLAGPFPIPRDLDDSLVELWRKANQGDTQSQYRLANRLESQGNGPGPTIEKLYQEAADQGHPKAQMALVRLYAGAAQNLVQDNDSLRLHYVWMAARQGIGDAQVEIADRLESGTRLPRDSTAALKWYLEAAGNGNAYACYRAGEYHYYGYVDQEKYQEAAKWYRKAAELGNAEGQYSLGFLLYHGKGVPKSYSEAGEWFLKAADQGNIKSHYFLGLMHWFGRGVQKSHREALRRLNLAADKGDVTSQTELGLIYYNGGTGIKKNYYEAVKWLKMAAENGYAAAQYNLGIAYLGGYGAEKSPEEARKWFKKAAKQGYTKAEERLASLPL